MRVQTYTHAGQARPGEDWRKPGDPSRLVRVGDAPPADFVRIFAGVGLVGVSREPCLNQAMSFVLGAERRVRLEREYNLRHDGNALCVYGAWTCWNFPSHGPVGWVPRAIAEALALHHAGRPLAVRLAALLLPRGERPPGVCVDLGVLDEARVPQRRRTVLVARRRRRRRRRFAKRNPV